MTNCLSKRFSRLLCGGLALWTQSAPRFEHIGSANWAIAREWSAMSLTNTERLSSVVDYEELVTRCLNKIDFAERMLTLFQSHCGKELAVLEQACEAADLEAVRRISHRLAGAAANAAANGLQ